VVAAQESARTHQIVHRRCVTAISVADVTLFANGTLRSRERFEQRRELLLVELDAEELDSFQRRLLEIDLSEVESTQDGVEGDFIGQCAITLRLPGDEERFLRFGQLDSMSLALRRLDSLIGELGELAWVRSEHGALPDGYRPTVGDFVRRSDGAVFEVVGFTSDERGVEVSGIDQPVTLYVALEDFREVFVALETKNLHEIDR
jgi:hypothetical protein